ncbi:hypothetical protein EC968_000241 [Mortierella alpina]|nr:hypothetical protein EC968_000241 [Mortierella alpina]
MKTLNLDSEENSKLLTSDQLKYTHAYFGIHFAGTNSRGILAYADANWTPIYPSWPAEKTSMPFELLPVVTITHPDGKSLELSENVAIDIFLAKQFGLHGNNAWEEALINSYYSHSNAMFFQETMFNYFWESLEKSEEEKAKYLQKYLTETLPAWAKIHETSLVHNQSNGHYVGNRTTLADIRTTTLLAAIEELFGKERIASVINETKTPAIAKLRATIEGKPSYAAWINSDVYKKLSAGSKDLVKKHHPEL